MIPKIIHYCWFGGKPIPENVWRYIDSWKKFLPDFKIKQWDETNFDVNSFEYTREAYYAKKYAFVSDVARLVALTKEGGLYLDTDIMIMKPVPKEMFENSAFCGFEHLEYAQTGVLACEPHHPVFMEFLQSYSHRHFFKGCSFDLRTNVSVFTDIMQEYGFAMDNTFQVVNGMAIYPQVVLCGKHCIKGRYDTSDTVMLHDFQNGWGSEALNHRIRFKLKSLATIIKWKLLDSKTYII